MIIIVYLAKAGLLPLIWLVIQLRKGSVGNRNSQWSQGIEMLESAICLSTWNNLQLNKTRLFRCSNSPSYLTYIFQSSSVISPEDERKWNPSFYAIYINFGKKKGSCWWTHGVNRICKFNFSDLRWSFYH